MEGFDWAAGFWFPYVNFFLFLGLLVYSARNPARGAVKKKRAEYEELVRVASAAKNSAETRLAELNERMQGLDQEIALLKGQALEAAEREAKVIIEGAERMAAHIRDEAGRVADAEADRVRQVLKRELVAEARAAVTDQISKNFSEQQQASLVQRDIKSLQSWERA